MPLLSRRSPDVACCHLPRQSAHFLGAEFEDGKRLLREMCMRNVHVYGHTVHCLVISSVSYSISRDQRSMLKLLTLFDCDAGSQFLLSQNEDVYYASILWLVHMLAVFVPSLVYSDFKLINTALAGWGNLNHFTYFTLFYLYIKTF